MNFNFIIKNSVASRSTSFSIINQGWLTYSLGHDFDAEAEEWPLLGKKGNDNIEQERKTVLYPNPTPGNVTLVIGEQFEMGEDEIWLNVYDMYKRCLLERKLVQNTPVNIDLKEYPPGIYIIVIKSQEGKIIFKEKLVRVN